MSLFLIIAWPERNVTVREMLIHEWRDGLVSFRIRLLAFGGNERAAPTQMGFRMTADTGKIGFDASAEEMRALCRLPCCIRLDIRRG